MPCYATAFYPSFNTLDPARLFHARRCSIMDHHGKHDSPGAYSSGADRVQKRESAADKMAALKARVAAAIGSSKAKGGLNVGLHPALEDIGSWKPPNNPASSTTNASPAIRSDRARYPNQSAARGSGDGTSPNPYLQESQEGQSTGPKARQPRHLVFNPKGKYIQQANAQRRQAALEAMKKRIAEQSRKAGIDDEVEVEKAFVVSAPPSIEWWDEALVVDRDYDRIDDPAGVKFTTLDTIITEYIQHPVPIEPPQDQNIPAPKPMYLTSKEQKKLRRQRRMADLKERQAKERLGLIPAPRPK
jgi:U4/U6 small nuclear ribonucleoprotein PRP3